jgi:lipopolysaccharide/colanic/teichoic acid biosynthesis glycosyltransferase
MSDHAIEPAVSDGASKKDVRCKLQFFCMNSIGNNHSAQEQIDRVSDRIARSRVPSWKRVLDCTLVLLTAPVWLPLGAITAIWVKLVSPGPALFRQERIGHMGARFLCLKFRTMKVNADTTVHREHLNHLMTSNRPMRKLDAAGDARLIPGGLWLRTLGVDELPQLLNVLRGEMSLVGPRPSTAYEYEMFQPRHRRRCETLPGLTGLWQVKGKNRTTFEKMMELDITYVQTKSLFLDVKILAGTLPAILLQVWDVQSGRRAAAKAQPEGIVARVQPQSGLHTTVLRPRIPELARGPALGAAHHTGLRAGPEPVDG